MDGPEGRRDVRHAARLSVTIKSGDKQEELFTEDVSYRGIFVRTDTPRQARSLVLMDIRGPNGEELELAGMVVHIIRPGGQRIPGMGIQFYGLSKEHRQQWQSLVDYVAGRLTPRSVRGEAIGENEHVRRRFPRYAAVLRVRVGSMVELTSLYTRNVSKGGMFIETTESFAMDETLEIEIVHPQSEQSFSVAATVRRVVKERGREGVGVEFVGLSDEDREAFWEFLALDLSELEAEADVDESKLE